MHINTRDVDKVKAILAEADRPETSPPSFPYEAMPRTSSAELAEVMRWEEALRTNHVTLSGSRAHPPAISSYWRRVLALFEVYRQIVHHPGRCVETAAWHALSPGDQWLMARRWPDRAPVSAAHTRSAW